MNIGERLHRSVRSLAAPVAVPMLLLGCSGGEAPAPVAETATPQPAQATEAPVREIVNLTGDLYRFRNNNHYSVFLVTPEGVILADPISADASNWLKAEIAQRFNVPVRYVLYSHHHWDHASGAAVFNDTAELVGHQSMPAEIAAYSAGLNSALAAQDKNGNNQLERDEMQGGMVPEFDFLDRNKDGGVTAAEIMADVLPPEVTYSGKRTVTLGGKSVELIHPGASHSKDMTVLYFPAERVAYGVDFVGVKRLPGGPLGEGTVDDWLNSVKAVEALDFDTFSPGHGILGTKADISEFRQYGEDLKTAVQKGIAEGMTLEQLQASIKLEKYSAYENYQNVSTNVSQFYQALKPKT
jgi:glyoxylase-like metal-dependent hydrolase (beta-lactamase superfamily II)